MNIIDSVEEQDIGQSHVWHFISASTMLDRLTIKKIPLRQLDPIRLGWLWWRSTTLTSDRKIAGSVLALPEHVSKCPWAIRWTPHCSMWLHVGRWYRCLRFWSLKFELNVLWVSCELKYTNTHWCKCKTFLGSNLQVIRKCHTNHTPYCLVYSIPTVRRCTRKVNLSVEQNHRSLSGVED